MDGINIKKLDQHDAQTARKLVESFKGTAASRDYLEDLLMAESHVLIAAMDGQTPAGFLLAYALQRIDVESAELFIYEIEVAREYRRRGIGSGMMDLALGWMRANGMVGAFVITNYSNKGAVEFYRSTGATIPAGDDLLFEYKGVA